jgi:hypothetical protein
MIPEGKSRHPHEMRKTHRLIPEEATAFNRLPPVDGAAWRFWKAIAEARGLDYRTILGNVSDRESFTALPLGHGKKEWCWPASIKCLKPPPNFASQAA